MAALGGGGGQEESNLHLALRRGPFYPLNYGRRERRIVKGGRRASGSRHLPGGFAAQQAAVGGHVFAQEIEEAAHGGGEAAARGEHRGHQAARRLPVGQQPDQPALAQVVFAHVARQPAHAGAGERGHVQREQIVGHVARGVLQDGLAPVRAGQGDAGAAVGGGHGHADRKSTRLNSSHSQISYAV